MMSHYRHITCDHSMVAAFQCVHKNCKEVFFHVHDYLRHSKLHEQASYICKV